MSDEEIAQKGDILIKFLFDERQTKADIYICLDRMLQLGIKHLYSDTKDITDLKNERKKKDNDEEKIKKQLFEFEGGKDREQKEFRKQLEKAYE